MKNKYWLKMYFEKDSTLSWVMKCDRLGEIKLFGYILSTMNPHSMEWYYDKYKKEAITKLIGITEQTIFQYLKLLISSTLLIKKGRGHYQVNREWIEYGSK